VCDVSLHAPPGARQAGQWIIGTALGLYFTPAVMREVASLWHLLLLGAVFAIAMGYASALLLAHLARIDRRTALFASVPGGAAEMSVLSEPFGARVDLVAAAHSLRILAVVVVVPAAYAALGVHGTHRYIPGAAFFAWPGFLALLGMTFAGGAIAQRLRVPNAFVLGPLAVAIPVTAAGVDLSVVPGWASSGAQLLLGCALGMRFGPEFVHGAARFVASVVSTVLFVIAVTAVFASALAIASGVPPATLVLGLAPGGIAEMCITAKVLELGVPLVTAFHVTRVIVLLLGTAPLFRIVQRVRGMRKS
jgi:membrane AbrB-like protein